MACINGFRNQVEFVLTGLDIEEKAEWVRGQLTPALTARDVTWSRISAPRPDADTEEGASVLLRFRGSGASVEIDPGELVRNVKV